jgi:hypothetical protein
MPDVVDHSIQAIGAVLRVDVVVTGEPPQVSTPGAAVIVAHDCPP